jgi:tetratricopeptide (TPR) repeat protein
MLSLFSGEREVLEANDLASSPEMADTQLGTAAVYKEMKRPYAAEPLVRRALDAPNGNSRRREGEEGDEAIGAVLFNLALIRWQQGDLAEAEQLLLKSLAIRRRLGGEDHPAVVQLRDTSRGCCGNGEEHGSAASPLSRGRFFGGARKNRPTPRLSGVCLPSFLHTWP